MSAPNDRAVAECKELRSAGLCPRECSAWRPRAQRANKFCGLAMAAEKGKERR